MFGSTFLKGGYIKNMQKRTGIDVGYHKDNMIPNGGEGVVGKSGIDKTFTLERES
jgi:hypothetical protein